MSERFAAAMGRKMVSRATAEELGELAHIVVDVEHRRIACLPAGKRRKALLVDWENVSGFGPAAVIVTGLCVNAADVMLSPKSDVVPGRKRRVTTDRTVDCIPEQ